MAPSVSTGDGGRNTEGQRLRAGSGEGAAGLRHRGGKNPAVGIGAGFASDIGAALTRQDILTNLQCGPSRRVGQGPREVIDEHSKKRSGPEAWRQIGRASCRE